ncbi:homoaconitase [Lentinula aciculospora]|uniref:Homoaconitase, mitochondrial n=1 Tax=Lentinula aciculospora TaxID=153920 RepID=A0A9W9ADE0_9AGAR|nr:homoaconitase [Lentinula aciculospora]
MIPRQAHRGTRALRTSSITKAKSFLLSSQELTVFSSRNYATSITYGSSSKTPQTVIEKVVERYAVGLSPAHTVQAGDYVMIRPEHVMTHDNTGPIISKFQSIGATSIHNPCQPVFTLDHDVQNLSPANLQKYTKIESFARQHQIDFYPAGRGIGHQILIEEGYAFPYTLTVASDSHSNMYGGVGCVGTPIVRTDAAALWATGKTWWQVPRMIRVELNGKLRAGVTGKDVIVALCGAFGKDEVLNGAVEFCGEGVKNLSVEERLTIANMTTEWGALAGVFPVDQALIQYYDGVVSKLERRTFGGEGIPPPPEHPRLNRARIDVLRHALSTPSTSSLASDPSASYALRLSFDLSSLVPHVSGPNSVKVATPLPKLEDQTVKVDKAYLVSCTNSRVGDLKSAADVFRGYQTPSVDSSLAASTQDSSVVKHRVHPSVQFYIAAASSVVQAESQAWGDWDVLVRAGAKVLPAGCGPCIGLGVGLLEEGEVGISATNRNYKGRMGHPNAQAYLASPAVVAASAVKGIICGPDALDSLLSNVSKGSKGFDDLEPTCNIVDSTSGSVSESVLPSANTESTLIEIMPLFPTQIKGPILFLPADNVSTDAIYPGKYTYQDSMSRSQMGEVVLENYSEDASRSLQNLRMSLDEPWVHPATAAEASTTQTSNAATPESSPNPTSTSTPTSNAYLNTPETPNTTLSAPLLISGFNFGTGSSREQAATSLLAAGVPLVVAGSFGDIFKRNAINNGLICLECSPLVEYLTSTYSAQMEGGKRSAGAGSGFMLHSSPNEVTLGLKVDMAEGVMVLSEENKESKFIFKSVGTSVQELWICGGLEGLVLKELKESEGRA